MRASIDWLDLTAAPKLDCDRPYPNATKYPALLGGCGIALLETFMAGDAFRTGRLETLMDDWKVPSTDIFAVLSVEKFAPSKTQVFVDFLVDRFRDPPDWDVS